MKTEKWPKSKIQKGFEFFPSIYFFKCFLLDEEVETARIEMASSW